nr:MlaD family protein [uncultured Pseudomonas sp.]
MVDQSTDQTGSFSKPIVETHRFRVSLVWIVPIVAVLVGISLVVHNIMQAGPTITVSFATGSGLTANKTLVKYRNVAIGYVSDVALSRDHRSVDVTIELAKEAESFTREDSLFWVVRPRIGASGISGMDTLLSGDYIGADVGEAKNRSKRFKGLETPPPITYGEPGKRFTLRSADLGSLDIGSPVYFRKIPVGQVVAFALNPDGKGVSIEIFVHAPSDVHVTRNTRFWNASGINLNMGADGFAVSTESLSSILMGGIAFRAPDYNPDDEPAAEESKFELFDDMSAALAPPAGKAQYLSLRFDQALRGLRVGAPIEFLGIEIGSVMSLNLDFDPEKRSFPTEVRIVIYPKRLGRAHTKMLEALQHDPDDEVAAARLMGTFVENGLRAQARTGNLLTGQLFIALDFYPDAAKTEFDATARPVMIPTIPNDFERAQEQLQAVVDKVSKLPLEQIAANLDGSLSEMRKALAQINAKTLPGMTATLSDASKALQSADSTFAEDSPQREQLTHILDELGRTARSLRELSDYLGRNPESLLRGRPDNAVPVQAPSN